MGDSVGPESAFAVVAEPGSNARYAVDVAPVGARRELLERAPAGATVLDIGCWSGDMGRFLAAKRHAVVDGVEPDPDMARLAAAHYRDVYVGPIERALAELLPQRRGAYDTLLLMDVLEHLVDPWAVLDACRPLLRQGGTALLSIPNVAHWSMRKELLLGRWCYARFGLLDRTHLRFFTRRSAIKLITGAGWRILSEQASVAQPPLLNVPEQGLRLLARRPSLFAFQLLFVAQPTEAACRERASA